MEMCPCERWKRIRVSPFVQKVSRFSVKGDVSVSGVSLLYLVVVRVCVLQSVVDWAVIPHVRGPLPLCHHVRPPHELARKEVAFPLRSLHVHAAPLLAVLEVALVRVKDGGEIAVVLGEEKEGRMYKTTILVRSL